MSKIETILFDLDGTIVNTNELIIKCFQHVMEKQGQPGYGREKIIPFMGQTLEQQLEAFTGMTDVELLVKDYRAYQAIHHDALIQEFPHVDEVMAKLHEQGYTLGVVTTKVKASTDRVLEMFGMKKYLSTIVTLEDVEFPKPDPQPVLTAVERLGANPATTLMVGDSPADIQSALAAGVKAAGVAWSLKGKEKLLEYGPHYMLDDMRDLYQLVGMESEA
ncbi:pyrophosphatase PpaX [Paenibacillus physcomitrellae]|uniref:Pyrophosphatase PpaX n=1 Tax=Paenibacillus physcomitrellae TaxID=1619311 RepID=A0ABQ1GT93_9BACL|nr:pyrophosphatase PpaX [Paenibacillus physcomitrellae]GGA49677.1 pyrophosphatase PpaX [Paenibacillus physcomitrellae]